VDVIALARDLKSRAMNERDIENWDGALELLTEAKTSLEHALNELPTEVSSKDTKLLEFETSVNKALYGMLGSIGGVYRRRAASSDRQKGDLEAAVDFYDKGHEIEKRFTDSYNLTQRLVTRVLLDPPAAFDESENVAKKNVPSELREARSIINEQTGPNGPRRNDEYAFADAAVIALILGETQWMEAINEFTNLAPKSSYARNVTVDLLKELEAELKSSDDEAVRSLCKRIERAVKLAS
jgi:tetratricopeptide (TPR) repeat protein